MFKFIVVAAVMIACVAAAPGLASLGHGPILGGYAAPLALPAPISYGGAITKIAAPISYAAPITKIAAPAYAPLGGHIGLGAPLGLGAHGLGLGAHGLGLGAHGLGLGYGYGAHGLGAPIW